MDCNKWHFERFSCGLCALIMIELLNRMFAHKTSSCSVRLSLHVVKPDVTFHGNHTHTKCRRMHSHKTHNSVPKPQGSLLCKLNCLMSHTGETHSSYILRNHTVLYSANCSKLANSMEEFRRAQLLDDKTNGGYCALRVTNVPYMRHLLKHRVVYVQMLTLVVCRDQTLTILLGSDTLIV